MQYTVIYTAVNYYALYSQAYGLYKRSEDYYDMIHSYDTLSCLAEVLSTDVKTLIDFYRIAKKKGVSGFWVSENKDLEIIFKGLTR